MEDLTKSYYQSDPSSKRPGVGTTVYYTERSNITTMSAASSSGTTLGDRYTFDQDFVLEAMMKWNSFYISPEKSSVVVTQEGEPDSPSWRNVATLQHPGDAAYMRDFIDQLAKGDYVFLIPEKCPEGTRYYQFASDECDALQIKGAELNSGMANSDSKHSMFTIEKTGSPVPTYTGTIDLDDQT